MKQPRFVDSYDYRTKLVVAEGYDWNIYGHPANISYFLKTPLVAAGDEGVRETKAGSKKAHTRRRYVGDQNPINVDQHPFDYLSDPGRRVGSAIPGWSFILNDGTEKRQFTTDGDVQNLILFLEANIKAPTRVYTGGASTLVKPAAENG